MQVVQKTSTRLKLREQLLGVWLLAAFVAALGLLIFIGYEPPVDWLGGLFIAIASFLSCLSPMETCIFDKQKNRVILRRRRLLGSSVRRHGISQIQDIWVQEQRLGGTAFYRVNLRLLSGQSLPLTQFPSTDWQLQASIATTIENFLQR